MTLTFLGQSGFVIDDGWRVIVDPFLGPLENASERERFPRLFDPPMTAEDLETPDLVLVSHHHGDHCHVATLSAIARRAPSCRFVATPSARDVLVAAGLPAGRLIVPDFPGWLDLSGVRLCVVPAAHYEFSSRPDVVFDYWGFVIDTSAGRVYSAGDTIPFNGLTGLIRSLDVGIALLPVNGRDADRERLGIVGNMDVRESASLVRDSGVSWTVPCHFGMFAANTVDIAAVADTLRREAPNSDVWVPAPGTSKEF